MNEDKYVLVFYDATDGRPDDPENMPTSPIVIKRMCDDLMAQYFLINGYNMACYHTDLKIRDYNLVGIENIDIQKMAWGDWLKVAYDPNNPNDGLYLVKVVDSEIESLGGGEW